MKPTRALLSRTKGAKNVSSKSQRSLPPLIQIQKGTFYRQQPPTTASDDGSPPPGALFPGLTFDVEAESHPLKHWAVIGPSNAGKTTLLEIFRGQHLCFPPTARRYPYLSTEELLQKSAALSYPQRAIQYVGFSARDRGLSGMGTYLSARYESRREETDFTLQDYLVGNTQLNPSEEEAKQYSLVSLDKISSDLHLQALLDRPVTHLSNGQTRRARIAKALLAAPELLLLDEPFSGLDPRMTLELSPLLKRMAEEQAPRIFLSLRPQDPIPYWITHVAYLGKDLEITHADTKDAVIRKVHEEFSNFTAEGQKLDRMPRYVQEFGRVLTEKGIESSPHAVQGESGSMARWKRSAGLADKDADKGSKSKRDKDSDEAEVTIARDKTTTALTKYFNEQPQVEDNDPVLEMHGVKVKYGDRTVLGGSGNGESADGKQGLWLTIRRGERWGIFGANGSGKTTLLSLITSDHPQAYSAPLRIFGRSRLPSQGRKGVSLFELQSCIGHSSPEVHSYFPRHLTVRQALESAYADTPLSKARLDVVADERIDALLRWFQAEIDPKLGMYPRLKWEIFHKRFPEGLEDGDPNLLRKHLPHLPHRWDYPDEIRNVLYEEEMARIDSVEWAEELTFGDLSFSGQRVVLFLRAIVSSPDIVILDEAFGGMDDAVRDKCLLFLEFGETKYFTPKNIPTPTTRAATDDKEEISRSYRTPMLEDRVSSEKRRDPILFEQGLTVDQALVAVSHVREEIPYSVRDYLYLPEIASGEKHQIGKVEKWPIKFDAAQWNAIWGMETQSS